MSESNQRPILSDIRSRRGIMGIVAVLNAGFAAYGMYLLIGVSVLSVPGFERFHDVAPHAFRVYLVCTPVVAALLIALLYSAIPLFRVDFFGARLARWAFCAELVYLFVLLFILPQWPMSSQWQRSLGLGRIATVSLMPQLLTAYPVIGLVATTLLLRQRRKIARDP